MAKKRATYKTDYLGKTLSSAAQMEAKDHDENMYFKEKEIKNDDEVKEESKNILKNLAAKMDQLKKKHQNDVVQNLGAKMEVDNHLAKGLFKMIATKTAQQKELTEAGQKGS